LDGSNTSEEGSGIHTAANVDVDDFKMVTPCGCRGSIAFAHLGCLKRWHELKPSGPGGAECNMCRQAYHGHASVVLCTRAINLLYANDAQVSRTQYDTSAERWHQSSRRECAVHSDTSWQTRRRVQTLGYFGHCNCGG
jgi:hypothetical protein